MKIINAPLMITFLLGMKLAYADPTPKEILENKELESFFYNKGYNDGLRDGVKKGAKKAFEKATRTMGKYEKKIKAMEMGKYLFKKQKITPPRLYQVQKADGSISVVVKGCKLEKQLSPNEILMLPSTENTRGARQEVVERGGDGTSPVSDSIHLPGVDTKVSIPTLSGSNASLVYRFYADSTFYRDLFRVAGKPYSIVGGNKIKVIFKSEDTARRFNLRYKLGTE